MSVENRIRIRLVPKTKQGESLTTMYAPTLGYKQTKRFSPDPDRAFAARSASFSIGLHSNISPKNSLAGLLEIDKFESMFGTKLVEKKSILLKNSTGTEKYLSPESELKVPRELEDTIAFAYVPTPPQFFSPTPVPPNVSVYHLHTADIVRLLRASRCHRHGWTGRGIKIAMTDTGFARHPFFDDNGFNIKRVPTPSTENPEIDTNGHGTGESANALSIAPDCEFFGVKHDDYSVEALETAIAQNPQIITNSWGWNVDSKSMQQLKLDDVNLYNEVKDIEQTIADAIDDGICVIFAGGNGHLAFPGSMPSVISVGGTTVAQNGGLKASSYASSFISSLYPIRSVPDFCGVVGESGSSPLKGHIMLPVPNGSKLEGDNMPSSQSKKGWGIFSGTSAAAPQIAGIAALMLSVNPQLSPDEIKAILSATAVDVTKGKTAHGEIADIGNDLATGSGLVDAYSACLQVQQTVVAP